jgi:hypothetical protein
VYAILIGVGLYFSDNCETELSQAARLPQTNYRSNRRNESMQY